MTIFTTPHAMHVNALQRFKDAFSDPNEMHGGCSLSHTDNVSDWVEKRLWAVNGSICGILYDEGKDIVYAISRFSPYPSERLICELGFHFGFCVHPAYRRQGYGMQILCGCIQLGRDYGLDELKMAASEDNPASWGCMEKAGAIRIEELNCPAGKEYIYSVKL